MVSLDKVVGGEYPDTSLINDEDPAIDYVFKIINSIQGKQFDVCDNYANSPIKIDEHRGDYFVGSDGQHRIATLKSLKCTICPHDGKAC
jgi:hypothetical protein